MPEEKKTKEPLPPDVVPVVIWRRGLSDPVMIMSDKVSWLMLQERIVNEGYRIKGGGATYILDSPRDENGRRTRFFFSDVVGFAGSTM
jgi:hypothetical protein